MEDMTSNGSGLEGHTAAADAFVTRAVEAHRAVARAQAALTTVLAEAHRWARGVAEAVPGASSRTGDLEVRDLAAQLGAALHLSDRTVQGQMDAAASLASLFPATLAAWSAGEVGRAHVAAIVEAGAAVVDDAAREWFETRTLALAVSMTAAQLRPAARALAEHAHPESLHERHERARTGRRVIVSDLDDGMARILADLPAVLAHGIRDRLTTIAREVHAAERVAEGHGDDDGGRAEIAHADGLGDVDGRHDIEGIGDAVGISDAAGISDDRSSGPGQRTMDHLRADVFADLLLAGSPTAHDAGHDAEPDAGHDAGQAGAHGARGAHGSRRGFSHLTAQVQVTVPVLTALGASREPCLLAGYGPIPLSQALELAGGAPGWDRVMTSPVDGSVLAVDRYRPSEQLRRLLRARDEHCRFVGCRQPVHRCDADHTVDHAQGGATSEDNLATLCRRHHVLKHRSQWRVEQLGRGRLRWHSPAGRSYVDRPAPTVRFVSDVDPPPDRRD